MKKNIIIIVMAVIIIVMGTMLVIGNNKINDCDEELTESLNKINELEADLTRVQDIAGDLFEENLQYMEHEEELEAELAESEEISDLWEKLYYGDYDNYGEEYEDHSGVSLTDDTYKTELEYNSKKNDWNN